MEHLHQMPGAKVGIATTNARRSPHGIDRICCCLRYIRCLPLTLLANTNQQRLYEIMMAEIIPTIQPDSERATWTIEASHWRLPYWDWSANQPGLGDVGIPQLFTTRTITVLMPNRRSQNFANPLWSFRTPNGRPFGDQSLAPWNLPRNVTPVSIVQIKST